MGIIGRDFDLSCLFCKETSIFEVVISGVTLIMDMDYVLTIPPL
jgi:hypothetical protein